MTHAFLECLRNLKRPKPISPSFTHLDINYALIADRMYKCKLKTGDLDAFTAAQIADMQALAAKRRAQFEAVSQMVVHTSK